jgi:iron-sulfur cluster repair protein YtfE (RIC family)
MNGTYGIHTVNPFCVRAVAEHRMLHGAFVEVRKMLDAVKGPNEATQPAVNAAVARIGILREAIAEHFRREEEGGYLEEAVGRNPALAVATDALQQEHAKLLAMADELLDHATRKGPAAETWKRLVDDLDRFEKFLKRHEGAEDALLQQAFNEDLGT